MTHPALYTVHPTQTQDCMIVGFEKCRFSLIREESGEGAWGSMGEHGGTWESMGEHGRGREHGEEGAAVGREQ